MNFQMTEAQKAQMRNIVGTALEDTSFKQRLIENPAGAIQELYPDFLPVPGKEIVAVDQSDEITSHYVNISRASYIAAGGQVEDLEIELTEEELELVAGGISCYWGSCNGGDGGNMNMNMKL